MSTIRRLIFSKQNRLGFTLMEMVIVVVVIGIIAAMAVPSFITYMPKLKVKSAAREIVSNLRLARSKSVSERRPYGVVFNLSTNTVITFADTNDPASQTYSTSDSLTATRTLGTDIDLSSCTYDNNCVVFNSTGAASTSGDLQIVTADGSVLMSINLLASTGRVRLTEIASGS
jgi:type II secretion system protein H